MTSEHRLKIIYSVPPPSSQSNPYTTMLAERVAEYADVDFFSWKKAFTRRHDVLHVHWPETLVRAGTKQKAIVRLIAGHVYLTIAKFRGTKIIRTVHNLTPHEAGSRAERSFLKRLDAQTSERIFLSGVGAPASAVVIPHGHYRDWTPYRVISSERSRFPLLMFGTLRPYKGIEAAIRAFRTVPKGENLALHIAGEASDSEYADKIRVEASEDSRITVDARRLSDSELAQMVADSELVVLPYRDFYNSGAAILALSLGTPILVPRTPSTEALLEEFNNEWIRLYESDLESKDLTEAHRLLANKPGRVQPSMKQREWSVSVRRHIELYEKATKVKHLR